MSQFEVHTKEMAPTESAILLTSAEKAYGFIPNLLGVMAESPATLGAYLSIGQLFEKSTFSPTERQIIMLTTNRFNECDYCMAAHSAIAGMQNVPAEVIDAIRNDRPINDHKLEALRIFANTVIEKRAHLATADIAAFLDTGYTKAQVLEVILGISFKTLSNYVNHVAKTPLDDAFAAQTWKPVANRQER
jgi:uncharacterized peroxidase-related enzyme